MSRTLATSAGVTIPAFGEKLRHSHEMMEPRTICVDLNGVLDTYHGWQGRVTWHPPRPGAIEFLRGVREAGFRVVVLTVRDVADAREWLKATALLPLVDDVTNRKPTAVAYVDDRAVCFRGDFDETLAALKEFAPHWQASDGSIGASAGAEI